MKFGSTNLTNRDLKTQKDIVEFIDHITPSITMDQWLFIPSSPISINTNSSVNLFSFTGFEDSSPNVTKISNYVGGPIIIVGEENEKCIKLSNINGDEDVHFSVVLDYQFVGSASRSIEIGIKRPNVPNVIRPFLISRIDNSYHIGTSLHETWCISDIDNFRVHGFFPILNNQSGSAITINSITLLLKRKFQNG